MDKSSQIYALFDALYTLEDIREVYRTSLPVLNPEEGLEVHDKLQKLKNILESLESGRGSQKTYIVNSLEPRIREEAYINIQPIQAGGRLTPEARKALISYADGYSVCDQCLSPFRLDKIRKPPLDQFHQELAKFLGMDEARVVPGARRGFQVVVNSLVERGDVVILSSLAHYTEFLAIEQAGGVAREVPSENNVVTGEGYRQTIEEVKKETGSLPVLLMVDHFDYMYGNEHDIRGIGEVASEYGIPVLLNGAYSVGILPVNAKELGVDFVVGSGHKSMASAAPSGVVATTEEWAERVFRTTGISGDVTGRTFGIKEVEMLGCTLMGVTVMTMMASFPHVKDRVLAWDEEVKKSNYFVNQFERVSGSKVLSETPRAHTLSRVDTSGSFDRVAKTHKRRGYFFSDELKKRGIVGPFAGATRTWKLNVYGLTWDQIKWVSNAFLEIAQQYNLDVG
ncbi:MAG: O-phospho-L-seryl-tRNA:Cys-tRNA synthase [Theionarchaea archaeon]|nr:O-phospho-L-seryl-tRNA:Cys-tRNA synthase [Theionarchaea archaeon]MBU7036806.1 O-phospho-L-seryl-tRNA:Cys-tRNA synthase [Theionarchaea archaeon]